MADATGRTPRPLPAGSPRLGAWIDERFPMTALWKEHVSEYYAPKNFNFWYYFGSLALFVLALQIVTGIFLTMSYKPSAAEAFGSVEYIMRDVEWGWLIRYMHSTGASAFFIVVYLHMFRALLYGSYQKPRELLWIFGMLIYLALMAEAFFGYLLPWGNMSYWGAQVIVSLFGAFPLIGDSLIEWIRGDYFISDITLNRFFALHVVALPLVLIFLVVAHILALHEVGSNNPDGVEIKKIEGTGRPSARRHPVPSVLHGQGPVRPQRLPGPVRGRRASSRRRWAGCSSSTPNFEPANPLHDAAAHRAGLVLHAVLRDPARGSGFLNKVWGVLALFAAVLLLFFVPWLDRSPVKSIRYRGPIFKVCADGVRGRASSCSAICGMKPAVQPLQGHLGRRHAHLFRVLPADAVVLAHRPTKPEPARVTYMKALRAIPRPARRHSRGRVGLGARAIRCRKRTTTSRNLASLQRGARNFVNYCLGCHSAKYVRYNRSPPTSRSPRTTCRRT